MKTKKRGFVSLMNLVNNRGGKRLNAFSRLPPNTIPPRIGRQSVPTTLPCSLDVKEDFDIIVMHVHDATIDADGLFFTGYAPNHNVTLTEQCQEILVARQDIERAGTVDGGNTAGWTVVINSER